ncbi:hypothetical protein NDU88_001890 [Pleurodeles waltl]|uniref:Uncharacterized protein n=1 Tax=Pleurodeles waltl TaxID=8319 RepID=A0AAV7Q5L7_PLEWA|nr:hypothetical protein NDU88_001890 [Pleurodeles waltl]
MRTAPLLDTMKQYPVAGSTTRKHRNQNAMAMWQLTADKLTGVDHACMQVNRSGAVCAEGLTRVCKLTGVVQGCAEGIMIVCELTGVVQCVLKGSHVCAS